MPYHPPFARFADLRDSQFPPQPATEFVRMPDGSLIMTRNTPTAQPSMLDRLKAAASRFIPGGASTQPEVPWWIAQPASNPAPTAASAPAPTGKVDPWAAIAAEAAHEEALSNELGSFSKAVMDSPELIEGKWWGK